MKPELKSAIGVDYITFASVSIHADICLLISCVNTGFRIAKLTKNAIEISAAVTTEIMVNIST